MMPADRVHSGTLKGLNRAAAPPSGALNPEIRPDTPGSRTGRSAGFLGAREEQIMHYNAYPMEIGSIMHIND